MTPPRPLTRRQFVQQTSLAGAGLLALGPQATARAAGANERIVVGVMGTSRNSIGGDGRGTTLAVGFARQPNVEVAYICDVDSRNVPAAIESVSKVQEKAPRGVGDFRRVLDDPAVDLLVIGAPDHWHAPATILGCKAGKHVYVEKPCCHNPHEGELMVAAARKYDRRVQLGTQRRSFPSLREAIGKLREGVIGKVTTARAWYHNRRPSIGQGKAAPVPDWLDWSLYQGPAPARPFQDNIVHYNWHWLWHWGTGELGNNGIHRVDVCRWGLGVDYPTRVTSAGGRYRYEDDQETPDTQIATFEFGDKMIYWEGHSCDGHTDADSPYEVMFYGDQGRLGIRGSSYVVLDATGRQIDKGSGPGGEADHLQNLCDGIREGASLNAEIEEGYKSTLLCHLGNIAQRTGDTLDIDPSKGRVRKNPAADALWAREYEPGWEPTV